MLHITDLVVQVGSKTVLNGLSLHLPPGQIHAIMGPNGSGKSSLAYVLSGHPEYTVISGQVRFQGQDLLALSPEARAHLGLFLAFQYPTSIPGLGNLYLLQAALNAKRAAQGLPALEPTEILKITELHRARLQIPQSFLTRGVNEGFSGGEKKRNEMLQLLTLAPALAVLDETDSGLDVDALRLIAEIVNALRAADRSFLIITHYDRLLEAIAPDAVHVLSDGRIIQSGGPELPKQLQAHGYQHVLGV